MDAAADEAPVGLTVGDTVGAMLGAIVAFVKMVQVTVSDFIQLNDKPVMGELEGYKPAGILLGA